MATRLLQVSDLHVGSSDPEIETVVESLRVLVETVEPALVVASGDLTHHNRSREHREAAEILRSLGPPVLAIPGNHDIPATPPKRLTHPYAAFVAEWQETEPVFATSELVVVGLVSVCPWLYQEGVLRSAQLDRAARRLEEAPASALRVAVTHHHLASAPWRSAKRPLMPRSRTVRRLAEAGFDLVLAGHVHQASSVAAGEFRYEPAARMVLATAPGLGRPRQGRHAEVRGVNVVETDGCTLVVRAYAWSAPGFVLLVERHYPLARSEE
ncbi:MAG: metallophosphoesterase family protein, partial [Gaiellales bacterium]